MPTKHKRKRDDDDKSHYDLPPTSRARPLPVITPTKQFLEPRKRQKLDKPRKQKGDDTPKAFARLMAWTQQGKKIGGGLDDGNTRKKHGKHKQKQKQKHNKSTHPTEMEQTAASVTDDEVKDPVPSNTVPKILPGETLTQFAIRVDQSLPLSAIAQSSKGSSTALPEDLRQKEKKMQHLTKHNKRLARMQAEWRNTEAKLKAKEEEEAENNEEKVEEEKMLWDEVGRVKRRKKGIRIVDDDPWKVLEKRKRAEDGKKRGLNASESAQQPPELKSIKTIFKVNENAGVRKTATPATLKTEMHGQRRQRKPKKCPRRGVQQLRLRDGTTAAIEAFMWLRDTRAR